MPLHGTDRDGWGFVSSSESTEPLGRAIQLALELERLLQRHATVPETTREFRVRLARAQVLGVVDLLVELTDQRAALAEASRPSAEWMQLGRDRT